LERVTVDKMPPRILTPAESRLIYKATRTVMRPYVVLGLYVGLRPEEITRLDWSHIDLEAGTVRATGKRRTRLVTMEPLAVKLLREHPLKKGPVAPCNSVIDRWRVKIRKLLGLDRWPQDLLRHTAASYLLALIQDAGKVATRLGNSVKVLNGHYLNVIKADDCAEFWSLHAERLTVEEIDYWQDFALHYAKTAL
jgi:integrase